jgi:hypothetical protein
MLDCFTRESGEMNEGVLGVRVRVRDEVNFDMMFGHHMINNHDVDVLEDYVKTI